MGNHRTPTSVPPTPASGTEPPRSARWREATLRPTATVREAIQTLDATGLQIVLVTLDDGTLFGTLTDGDIRRGMLRGTELDSPIGPIAHTTPLVVPAALPREPVLGLMQANRVQQLPIIDPERRVVGLHLWNELVKPQPRGNTMAVMAGGRGVRLRPHTESCPKPLLPVAGKPMLEHIIERAIAEGITRFVIAVHYLGHMIEEYFTDGSRWGAQITYLHEPEPLGTAGALGLLDPRPGEAILVSNGDVLTDARYGEILDFHARHGATATMAVRLHEWQHPFGVVRTSGVDIAGFEEKPVVRSHVNAGIYVLEPEALDLLPSNEPCDMPALFARLMERDRRTIVYPMHEPWLDVGRDEDLRKANESPK